VLGMHKFQGALVCRASLGPSIETTQEIGTGSMKVVAPRAITIAPALAEALCCRHGSGDLLAHETSGVTGQRIVRNRTG
jgi:hypothetical protein